MESKENHVQYMIGGVPVLFPCKPYPSQIAMMAKIMRALERGENALLESPTGSGKSLALLCSCLAWQKQMKDKLMVEKQKSIEEYQILAASQQEASKSCQCQCHGGGVSTICNTPCAGQTGGGTPVNTLPYNPGILSSSIDASTGQGKIKSITAGQAEIKGVTFNQGETASGQREINNQSDIKVSNQNLDPDQEDVKDHDSGQKDMKVLACCDNNSNCDNINQILNNSTNFKLCVSKFEYHEKSESTKKVADCSKVDHDDDDDFKPPKKKYRIVGRKKKGVIYDDDDEEEEGKGEGKEVNNEGDKCSSGGGVEDQSADVAQQQQQNDSSSHPSWKMQLTGATPTRQQADVINSSVSMVTTPNGSCHGFEVKQEGVCGQCQCGAMKAKQEQVAQTVAKKIPVIFFGTRTHKQIKQITHELKKTAYAKTPMSILASREHTCVHPLVSLSKNKNEECHKLIDALQGDQCSYYHNVGRFATQANIASCGLDTAWDIEDLVMLGKKKRVCPYFVTRGLKDEAQIVFCPYNYLLDPMVTNQMDLHLEGNVIVLDEGHNVEDTARDSASLAVTVIQLEEVVDEMDKMLTSPTIGCDIISSYNTVKLVCNKYIDWMKGREHHLPQQTYEQGCKVWHGSDMVEEMKQAMGITPHLFEAYKAHLNSIIAAAREPLFAKSRRDRERYRAGLVPTVNMATLAIVENLFIVLGFLLNPSFTNDYRVALMKTTAMRYEQEEDGWNRRQRRRGHLQKVWTLSLNFWCLNPSVAFSGFNSVRCVILTSGTLSPMLSFASELGTSFPIQLEANHVITSSQVWIGTLCSGPHGRQLCASYQNTESFDFQDEIGRLILDVCKTVPYGILCFFTSYKMLEKLTNRWKTVGIWEEITQRKVVVCEPRAGDKADFERSMMVFYEAINHAHHNNATDNNRAGAGCAVDGALFLAVCRGKVSEGLDFVDNNARAVITVGIPYPYIKDKQVELKKEYNNEHCVKKGLLNGGEWYEIQAYRALNQALGRCIRHKKDWGALILVDERFSKSERYTRGLSKWVRQGIRHYTDYPSAQMSLKNFAEERLATSATSDGITPPNFMSSCNVSTATLNTSSYQSPPSTPVRHPPMSLSCSATTVAATSPPQHAVVLPSLPVLSPQTYQAVQRNPLLAGLIAEQLRLNCLQRMANVSGNQLPAQVVPGPISNCPTPVSVQAAPRPLNNSTTSVPLNNSTTSVPLNNSTTPVPLNNSKTPVFVQVVPGPSNNCTSSVNVQVTAGPFNNCATPPVSMQAAPSCTRPVAEAQEAPMMHTTAKIDLTETVIIPASPPVGDDNPTLCDSPPLFSSPVKQPMTSTQLDSSSGSRELEEALDITGAVKLEQHNTVVSLSSPQIKLPPNLTACDQMHSTMDYVTDAGLPDQQRQSSRKRQETQKMANFRHAKKRQYKKQAGVKAKNKSMCCVECHKELATLTIKTDKDFVGVDLVSRLLKLVSNGSKSLLIDWLSGGDQQAYLIPTNQLLKTSHLRSLIQGGFNAIWDNATGLAYCPMACICSERTLLVEVVATNRKNTLSTYCNKTIIMCGSVNVTEELACEEE